MTSTTRDVAATIRQEVMPDGAKRLGLVIGIDRYQDARLNLRCARADAEAMRNLMLDPECGLFEADNVTLLADQDATRERIWRALAGLRRKAHKQDSVWIFYAGHGAPEGEDFYWVPHDGDVDDLYSTGLSRKDLNRVLDDIPSERIVAFMDCCHAAAMAAKKNRTRSVITAQTAFAAYSGRGRIVFAASDGCEKSVEIAEHGRGAFSYFLEKGLRGEADKSCKGVVTADDLWRYIRDLVSQTARAVGNPQTPVRIGEETHDFALSVNPSVFGQKQRLADIVLRLASTNQLTTEEEQIGYDLLRENFAAANCRALIEALDNIESEDVDLPKVKRIIQSARKTQGTVDTGLAPPSDKCDRLSPILPAYKEWYTNQKRNLCVAPEIGLDIILVIVILAIAGLMLKNMAVVAYVGVFMLTAAFVVALFIGWVYYRGLKNRYRFECARLCMEQGNYKTAKSFLRLIGRVGVDKQEAEKLTLAVADQALIAGEVELANSLYLYAFKRWASPVAEAKCE